MWFDRFKTESAREGRVAQLEDFHRSKRSSLVMWLFAAFMAFVLWASWFRIDEVTRATGEVIASSRVQVIQAVDGGVLSELAVKEGDRVQPGQLLARLDQTRVSASAGETAARLFALRARAARLRAEATGAAEPQFPSAKVKTEKEQIQVESALFLQRKLGLQEETRTLRVAVDLARKKLDLVDRLVTSGDASGSELLGAQSSLNDADSRLANRQNKFLEDARLELSKVEDEVAQNQQVLLRREQERQDAEFTANVAGIVKNVRVTTVGGVLRAGEELMQIVPINDELLIEAKVMPTDIARIHTELDANIRFDPFDYTIFGSVGGKVVYVSADTLKEQKAKGDEIYYRVHIVPKKFPVTSSTGRELNIMPGMTAQVDIRTGERTLMDYLLKPLRKTLSESFRER